MKTPVAFFLCCLSLAACITPSIRNWPDEVPPQRLFIQTYRADAQNQAFQSQQAYLEWILGFYQGTLIYPTGWLDVEDQLIAMTPAEHQPALDLRLEELGVLIGAEWAKENDARLIDNRMLALWGSTLQLMVGFDEQMRAIDEVAGDIDLLFKGELEKRDITEARYAEKLGFEVFGDF